MSICPRSRGCRVGDVTASQNPGPPFKWLFCFCSKSRVQRCARTLNEGPEGNPEPDGLYVKGIFHHDNRNGNLQWNWQLSTLKGRQTDRVDGMAHDRAESGGPASDSQPSSRQDETAGEAAATAAWSLCRYERSAPPVERGRSHTFPVASQPRARWRMQLLAYNAVSVPTDLRNDMTQKSLQSPA